MAVQINKPKVELRELVLALKDVTEWYDVGLQLPLPVYMLDTIKAERLSVQDSMREMLKKWLDYDPEASWEKLGSALKALGKRTVAKNIRSQAAAVRSSGQHECEASPLVVESVVAARNHDDDAEKCVILGKIRTYFSLLVTKVRSAMQTCQVDVSDVREFLITYHEGECDIPDVNDLKKIFESITKAKLWRYDHYSLLENLAESFIPDDDPARDEMTEYVNQLSAFYATTSIIEFLKATDQDDPDEDDQLISPRRYNRRYRKLTVKVKVDPNVPMKYVEKLWKSLMKEFHLPPLSAIVDKMEEGSLIITWLVLPHILKKIRATYFKCVIFFQQHNIIEIKLYGGLLTLYDEKWMEGSTPLFRASYAGKIEEVKALLDKGADIDQQNDNVDGHTPLSGASLGSGDVNIVRLFLEKGGVADVQNKDGGSALMVASGYGHTEVVKLLLEYKADVNLLDDDEYTALILACTTGNTDTVKMLLAHGAVVDHRDKEDGASALMYASVVSNTKTVKVLLQHGASLDLTDDSGRTAMMWASFCGLPENARTLLEKGATADHKDNNGRTALWYASNYNYPEAVNVLLEFGAEVDLPFDYEDGGTALTVASRKGHTQIVNVLLYMSHGALVDYQDRKGQTPLHHASVGGHVETVVVILENKAKVNLHNEDGWTALFLAAEQGHDKVVKTLLDHGAAVNIRSKSGLTALDVARAESHQAVCKVIEQHLNLVAKVSPEHSCDSDCQDQVGESGQCSKIKLTEEQRSEVRSVSERLWFQFKRIFLREVMEKREHLQGDTSPHTTDQPKGRRSIPKLFDWSGRRQRRQTQRQVLGTSAAPKH